MGDCKNRFSPSPIIDLEVHSEEPRDHSNKVQQRVDFHPGIQVWIVLPFGIFFFFMDWNSIQIAVEGKAGTPAWTLESRTELVRKIGVFANSLANRGQPTNLRPDCVETVKTSNKPVERFFA